MKAVIQRVKKTVLSADGKIISEIAGGLAVYLGVERGDTKDKADYVVKKLANMRIFEDANGKMNLSALDLGQEILLIPQFTLCADVSQGNRPSFAPAEEPVPAKQMFEYVAQKLVSSGVKTKTGVFGADMKIEQFNDGPVTIILQN